MCPRLAEGLEIADKDGVASARVFSQHSKPAAVNIHVVLFTDSDLPRRDELRSQRPLLTPAREQMDPSRSAGKKMLAPQQLQLEASSGHSRIARCSARVS
jgi:hypothetical protein